MHIQYQELLIRDAVSDDCEQLAAWWNDGRVMAHAGFPNGLGTTARKIAKDIAADDDTRRRRMVIACKGKLIGETSFSVQEGRIYEIGIKICDPDYQEKGLGRVLLSMLIEELFRIGASKIVLDTNLQNTRAQHVYELLGFRRTAVHIDSWFDQLGRPQSAVDYELCPADFINYKSAP